VIDEDGGQLGVMTYFDAMTAARTRGLDLVEVAPNAVPPVCRLMDYGRFKFDQEKRDREARKTQKTGLMKEVRMHPLTDDHDVDFKTKAIQRFLEDGDKVKVTVQFKGAQMRHPDIGRTLLEGIINRLKGVAAVERPIIMEGRNMSMMLGSATVRPRPVAAASSTTAGPAPVVPVSPMQAGVPGPQASTEPSGTVAPPRQMQAPGPVQPNVPRRPGGPNS